MKLYLSDKVFASDEHLKNWLIRVTINCCKKVFLAPWRKTEPLQSYAKELAFATPEQSGLFEQIKGLPRNYRLAIYLYYFEGYSTEEIAALLSRPKATIVTWLHRGRQQLKIKLLEEEQLGDYSAKNAKRIYVAPEEYQDYKAFTSSLYTWMTIDYQKDNHHGLSLSLGPMDNPMWAYCFHYDEEGNWQSDTYNYADAIGSTNVENLSTEEYRGCTIYLYDSVHLDYFTDSPIARYQDAGASWMDKEIGICFNISCNGTLWETDSDGYTYIRDEVGVTQSRVRLLSVPAFHTLIGTSLFPSLKKKNGKYRGLYSFMLYAVGNFQLLFLKLINSINVFRDHEVHIYSPGIAFV